MKPKDLRNSSKEELQKKLMDTKQEVFNLRFQMATSKTPNPKKLHVLKKDVARILTMLREREE